MHLERTFCPRTKREFAVLSVTCVWNRLNSGYLGLFFIGASVGKQTLNTTNNVPLGMHGFVLFFAYGALTMQGFLTSRKIVNSMFVLCVTALNLSVLSAAYAFQMFEAPYLLDAVNRNQFSVFLMVRFFSSFDDH